MSAEPTNGELSLADALNRARPRLRAGEKWPPFIYTTFSNATLEAMYAASQENRPRQRVFAFYVRHSWGYDCEYVIVAATYKQEPPQAATQILVAQQLGMSRSQLNTIHHGLMEEGWLIPNSAGYIIPNPDPSQSARTPAVEPWQLYPELPSKEAFRLLEDSSLAVDRKKALDTWNEIRRRERAIDEKYHQMVAAFIAAKTENPEATVPAIFESWLSTVPNGQSMVPSAAQNDEFTVPAAVQNDFPVVQPENPAVPFSHPSSNTHTSLQPTTTSDSATRRAPLAESDEAAAISAGLHRATGGLLDGVLARELLRECRAKEPAISVETIVELGRMKKEGINNFARVDNPAGFLRRAIPKMIDAVHLQLARERIEMRRQAPEKPAHYGYSVDDVTAYLDAIARKLRAAGYPGPAELLTQVDVYGLFHNSETLEAQLAEIEKTVVEQLQAAAGDERLAEARRSIKAQLKDYVGKMTPEQLAAMHNQHLHRRLLDAAGIPRISLTFVEPGTGRTSGAGGGPQ